MLQNVRYFMVITHFDRELTLCFPCFNVPFKAFWALILRVFSVAMFSRTFSVSNSCYPETGT